MIPNLICVQNHMSARAGHCQRMCAVIAVQEVLPLRVPPDAAYAEVERVPSDAGRYGSQ